MKKEKIEKKPPPKALTVIVMILMAAFVIYLFTRESDDSSEVTVSNAYIISQEFVKSNLVSPATADFPWSYDNFVQDNDTTFWINGHVDSQNGFGATIRTNYLIGLRYRSGDWQRTSNWELIELTFP